MPVLTRNLILWLFLVLKKFCRDIFTGFKMSFFEIEPVVKVSLLKIFDLLSILKDTNVKNLVQIVFFLIFIKVYVFQDGFKKSPSCFDFTKMKTRTL